MVSTMVKPSPVGLNFRVVDVCERLEDYSIRMRTIRECIDQYPDDPSTSCENGAATLSNSLLRAHRLVGQFSTYLHDVEGSFDITEPPVTNKDVDNSLTAIASHLVERLRSIGDRLSYLHNMLEATPQGEDARVEHVSNHTLDYYLTEASIALNDISFHLNQIETVLGLDAVKSSK